MAPPMTAKQFIAQLKKWGVNYQEYGDWDQHNRNHKGPWGPVHGVMWHHTGSNAKDQRALLAAGYRELPGPLSQCGISQTGVCHLIGWGRCNHAGLGDPDVLKAIIREDKKLPNDNEATVDGNRHFYGWEFWYSGSKAMAEEQYQTGILVTCAVLDFHNWDENSVLGHGQWQPGKWDPGYASGKMMDMYAVRKDVAAQLKKGPNKMADNEKPATKSQTYKEVWNTDAMKKPNTHPSETNTYWHPESLLRYAAEQAAQANQKADRILKHLGL